MKIRALALAALLLAGCDDSGPPSTEPADNNMKTGSEATKTPEPTIDVATLQAQAEQVALVPSPAEMEASLRHAGVDKALAEKVADRNIAMTVDNKDQLAVRTGVVLADLVLTVKESPKETMLKRLDRLAEGLEKLGAGSDVQKEIASYKDQITNDAITRDDLVKEFDELSQVMVPELEYEAGEWIVPLIQAGSWLEGAHLVSGTLVEAGNFTPADNLLRQPAVVDYFIEYVNHEGADKAPDEVVSKLKETLGTLKTVASKPTLAAADVQTVHDATGAVLSLL